jgi:oxygen-independent coproporphyrinogen-3 oxidase
VPGHSAAIAPGAAGGLTNGGRTPGHRGRRVVAPEVTRTAGGAAARDLWQPPVFDRALVRKYDVAGPRYTSYPTAPSFRDGFGASDYAALLARSAAAGAPLSLYVHVPFCDTRCLFCGCNVTIARDRERGRAYLRRLEREVRRVAALAGAGERRVAQVHWGGGTPTFLPADDLAALAALLRDAFPLDPEVEFGVEVDPRRCTAEQLDALAAAGVNRLSLGVQDVDERVQRTVRRVQPLALTREVIAGARARGIGSVNVDLIYGLPHQTPATFARTLDEVLALAPDRLAIFNFAYLPQMLPHQRALDPAAMPSADDKLTILEEVVATLTARGYVFIGMDHFALPHDPLVRELYAGTLTRNFQGYSTHGDADLLGLGASSIGQLAGGYAQNERTVGEYAAAVERGGLATCRGLLLSDDDELRRDVIVRLMCHFRVDKATVEERYGIDFDGTFAAELARLAPLADDGLLRLRREAIEVTPLGRLLVRNVAMAFDAYLSRPGPSFSRTV